MKKILLFTIISFWHFLLLSQNIFKDIPLIKASNMEIIRNFKNNPVRSDSRAVNKTFSLDYDAVDGEFANVTATNYARFVWNVNRRYPNDSSFVTRWGAVVFDTLFDFNSNPTYPFDRYPTAASQINIDSLYIYYGHFNTTGMMDTLVITIYKNDTLNTISNATGINAEVIWTDTIYTDSSLTGPGTGGSPVTLGVLKYAPGLSLPRGSTFSVQMDYYGPIRDKCFFIAGYRDACADACGGMLSQVGSRFGNGKNSFSLFVYKPFTGLGFQLLNHDLTNLLDCNSNGIYEDFYCENFYIQNIEFKPIITVNINPCATINVNKYNVCPDEFYRPLFDLNYYGFTSTPSFSWSPTKNLSSYNSEDPSFLVPDTGTITYTCTLISGYDTAYSSITMKSDGIIVDLGEDQILPCDSSADIIAQYFGETNHNPLIWNDFNIGDTNVNLNAGTYFVTTTNDKGCTDKDTVEIIHNGFYQNVNFRATYYHPYVCRNQMTYFYNQSARKTNWNWTWTNLDDNTTSNLENGNLVFRHLGKAFVKLEADSAGCKYSKVDTVLVINENTPGLCVESINDILFANNISIIPNPNNGTFELNIDGISAEVSINVVDMTGKVVFTENTGKISSYTKTLNLGNVSSGLYFVKVSSGENTAIKKLVIN